MSYAAMGGEARGERRSDGRGRHAARRLTCLDRSVERHVNASLATFRIRGTYDPPRLSGRCVEACDSTYLVTLLTHIPMKTVARLSIGLVSA